MEKSILGIEITTHKRLDNGAPLFFHYLWSLIDYGDRWISDVLLEMSAEKREELLNRIVERTSEFLKKYDEDKLDKHYWRVWDLHEIATKEDLELKKVRK